MLIELKSLDGGSTTITIIVESTEVMRGIEIEIKIIAKGIFMK